MGRRWRPAREAAGWVTSGNVDDPDAAVHALASGSLSKSRASSRVQALSQSFPARALVRYAAKPSTKIEAEPC